MAAVKCRIGEKVFVICNVYLSTNLTTDAFKAKLQLIDSFLQAFKCENVIMTGDFNTTLQDLDCNGNISSPHIARRKHLIPFLEKWDLEDVWRLQHPNTTRFTHHDKNSQSRRIDYFFSSVNVNAYISDCEIGNSYCSDHSPLATKLKFNDTLGRRSFCFPVDLCVSEQYKVELSEKLNYVRKENPEANPHTLWEIIKATIRSSALRFKSLQSWIRKCLVEEYEVKIARKTHERDMETNVFTKTDLSDEINRLNKSLDSIFEEEKPCTMLPT